MVRLLHLIRFIDRKGKQCPCHKLYEPKACIQPRFLYPKSLLLVVGVLHSVVLQVSTPPSRACFTHPIQRGCLKNRDSLNIEVDNFYAESLIYLDEIFDSVYALQGVPPAEMDQMLSSIMILKGSIEFVYENTEFTRAPWRYCGRYHSNTG